MYYLKTSDYSGEEGGAYSMLLNELVVYQANSMYYIYTQQQELKAMIYLPPDNQNMFDFKVLDVITKSIASRWGIITPTKKHK